TTPEFQNHERMLAQLLGRMRRQQSRFILSETHLSWVLVAGSFAYKIKKALQFGFVDYSELAYRRHFCEKELRLNQRLAPSLYIGVVPITGTYAAPRLEGQGEAIDYALKMHAIEQEALWSHRLSEKLVEPPEIDQLAAILAEFHEKAEAAPQDSVFGTPEVIETTAASNLAQLLSLASSASENEAVERLSAWSKEQAATLKPLFLSRRASGFIRECHGDLHQGNILTSNGTVQVFDCLEFNDKLRWIDVINDIAFAWMALQYSGHSHYAARFLNRYLEQTGDYEGLRLLPYYAVHRALVRSMVAFIRASQALHEDSRNSAHEEAVAYLAYASASLARSTPCIMLTHGFSGCGKTSFARQVVEQTGAVQLRSDVERKRLFGAAENADAARALNEGLYHPDTSRKVYAYLRYLARTMVEAGFPVIVDAAFLEHRERQAFRELAAQLKVPFHIFDLHADPALLEARIAARRRHGQDASDATQEVLRYQRAHHEPLSEQEKAHVIRVDMNHECDAECVRQACAPILNRRQNGQCTIEESLKERLL
ncbi:MAG: AAA family ATPase, partial [Burkholderiaceae bacterium]